MSMKQAACRHLVDFRGVRVTHKSPSSFDSVLANLRGRIGEPTSSDNLLVQLAEEVDRTRCGVTSVLPTSLIAIGDDHDLHPPARGG
jgi:hypothetical protein